MKPKSKSKSKSKSSNPPRPLTLFALWKNSGCIIDHATTMLGSPVAAFRDDGSIVAAGYGGAGFRPSIVLPLAAGRAALADFERLVEERREAHKKFVAEWGAKYEALKAKYNIHE